MVWFVPIYGCALKRSWHVIELTVAMFPPLLLAKSLVELSSRRRQTTKYSLRQGWSGGHKNGRVITRATTQLSARGVKIAFFSRFMFKTRQLK